ncbi:TonB-dependent receptor [Aureibacter tunicatorum]|nr:TonB-dependent receptor [Aureibacter tunicatorum]
MMLFIATSLAGQTITILDKGTSKPVEGVIVAGQSEGKGSFCLLTDLRGKLDVEIEPPYLLTLRHMSYEDIELNISDTEDVVVKMARKDMRLDPVVVTAQTSPQSVRNSVYKVKTVSAATIEKMGAVDLESVLSNQLNIRFEQDGATGTSNISMMGISGQNVKVLIDGLPLTGRSGVNNEIDLNQINLSTVERVEVIEGPMAVNFGADALAGVINIITKKDARDKVNVGISLQEESVGDEYGKDQGLRRQDVNLGYRITDNLFASIAVGHNDFNGWKDGNESNRSHLWLPKEQWMTNGLLRYRSHRWDVFYKFDYLDEQIDNLGEPNPINNMAFDQLFVTNRWNHQLQANININRYWSYNASFAFQDYERTTISYNYNTETGEKTTSENGNDDNDIAFQMYTAKGTFNKRGSIVNYQFGYDINIEQGTGARIDAGNTQSIEDYALFASAEIMALDERLKIRPGLRYAYNSKYNAPVTPQINAKYNLTESLHLRANYGRGFRAPTLKELYFDFVDSNHNIIGNPDLLPETSDNVGLGLSFAKGLSNDLVVNASVNGFYNKVNDKIEYIVDPENPQVTTLGNIGSYKTLGANIDQSVSYKSLHGTVGFGYIGVSYQDLDDQIIYYPEINASVSYTYSPWDLNMSLFYKFNGGKPFVTQAEASEEYVIDRFENYHTMDFTMSKSLVGSLKLNAGIKNIFDIKDINTLSNTSSGGAHGGGASRMVGYGRSYFVSLKYNFAWNKK